MNLSTRQGRQEQGQRIQRAVEGAGISVEELAGRIGCSRALIYQYLSGTTLAQPDRLQQIAQECGVSLAYFYEAEAETTVAATLPPAPGKPRSKTALPPALPQEMTTRLADSLRAFQELADAQETPPDYRALASTCERILSLAAQIGDRRAQSQAQKRLGTARLRLADFPRAAEALSRAVAFAEEAGDLESETTARQNLGNALLAMGRVAEARQQFSRIAGGTVFEGRWQGTVSLGGIEEMQGDYQQAMARFDEAAAILENALSEGTARPQEIAVAMLYVNTNRRNVYMDGGDFRGAHSLAERSLADAEALGNADQHLEARFDLAWCDFGMGRWAAAHRGFATMLQLARFVGDQGRETMARAWLGIFLAAAGDHDAAIEHGKDGLALALSRGDRRGELYAQLCLADAYTGAAQRDSEARYHTNQALAVTTALRYGRGEVECRLRLARLSAQAGDIAELRDAAAKALTLAQRLGARHLESLARCWMAEAELTAAENANRGAASEHARIALEMADEMPFVEARWRAAALLASLAAEENPETAAAYFKTALETFGTLRTALLALELPDTLLENAEILVVYENYAGLLRRTGREEELNAFLEQAGWPPLTARLAAERETPEPA